MLGDGNNVGARNLDDGDILLVRGVQIDMITSDAGRNAELEVLCRLQDVSCQISRVEWSFGIAE